MKRETYHYGVRGKKYGIWNTVAKKFQFGICEDTPMLAEARLYQKLGDDARKWRFEPRMLPDGTLSRTEELTEKLKKVKAERDAAVQDLKTAIIAGRISCDFCDHGSHGFDCEEVDYDCARCSHSCPCKNCSNGEKWEWRGISKKETTP